MNYTSIDHCDRCGTSLEKGQWLSGLCQRCEAEAQASPTGISKPRWTKKETL